MSTTGRPDGPEDAPAASDVAGALRDADFVRFVAAATGDALAASGVLARALDARGCPYQVSVAPLAAPGDRTTDADLTVALGRRDGRADLTLPGTANPASESAFEVATTLDADPDPALALAGAIADGRATGTRVAEAARGAGIDRRPGVGVPTEGVDLPAALAASTLFHAPLSGDENATADALAGLEQVPGDGDDEADAWRRVASLVALRTVGHGDATPRAAEAVERALRPHAGGPLGTVEGFADVLSALARDQPGTGVALALGDHDVTDAALSVWRDHGRRAHEALRAAETGRYDGLFVARTDRADAPVGTVARLLHDYRSPEPVSAVVADDEAAVVATDREVGPLVRAATGAADANGDAVGTRGRLAFDCDRADVVLALREGR